MKLKVSFKNAQLSCLWIYTIILRVQLLCEANKKNKLKIERRFK